MEIVTIPCLQDNFAYLLICPKTAEAAIVDPSEADPVRKEINEIVKVEDHAVHKHSTDLKFLSNVQARRTAWDTHLKYPSMLNISKEFIQIIQSFKI